MSSKKKLSMDEKRIRLRELFIEKGEFFNLKELEKIASKEKGIVMNTVKDVLQTLIDDETITSDKIGTSTYYWIAPQVLNLTEMEERSATAKKRVVEVEFRQQKLKEEIAREKINKNDCEEKQVLCNEVDELMALERKMKQDLAKGAAQSPQDLGAMQEKVKSYKGATNVWTDNIFAVQSWCEKKFNIEKKEINKQFKIPEDMDYK